MTKKEELLAILKKNPKAIAKFISYYKFEFEFVCEGVVFNIGGDMGIIYRFSVDRDNLLADLKVYLEDNID